MSRETKTAGPCFSCTTSPDHCASTLGDEWILNDKGYTSCGSCYFDKIFVGQQNICKHAHYLGDPLKCCLGQDPGNQRTCDPNYNLDNPKCDNAMIEYCGSGNKWLTDSKCVEWTSRRPSVAAPYIMKYCDNFNVLGVDSNCRAWCLANPGSCDAGAVKYCQTKKQGETFCNCINSNVPGVQVTCIDRDCQNVGYRTVNMTNPNKCPSICYTSINAKGNVNYTNNVVKCGSSSTVSNSERGKPASNSSSALPSAAPKSSFAENKSIVVAGGVSMAVVIMCVLLLFIL